MTKTSEEINDEEVIPAVKIQSRTFKAAILASGQFLASCAGIIGFAVLSRVFNKQDYATYRQTILAYRFVAPLLILGLPQALYYFLPDEKKRPRGVLYENMILLTVLAILFSLFLLCGGNRLLAWRFNNLALNSGFTLAFVNRSIYGLGPFRTIAVNGHGF